MRKIILFLLMVTILLMQITFIGTSSADSTYTLAYELVGTEGEYSLTVTGFETYPKVEYELVIPDTADYDIDENGTIEENEKSIPVTKIAAGAFADGYDSNGNMGEYGTKSGSTTILNDLMTGLTIGKNVKAIGDEGSTENNVFTYLRNTKFTTLTIPDNVEFLAKHSFTQSYFTTVNIGKGVTSLGFAVFNRCNKITTVSTYVSSFESTSAFNICKAIERINLYSKELTKLDGKFSTSGENDIVIYVSSASVAQKLSSLGYDEQYIMYPINEYTFSVPVGEKSALSYTVSEKTAVLNGFDLSGSYELPYEMDLVIPEKVTDSATGLSYTVNKIAESAFAKSNYADYAKSNAEEVISGDYIYSLKSITIPSTVTTIGASAFEYNDKLISANISGSVTDMGTGLFKQCRNMTSVELSEGTTSIPGMTFNNCQKLEKLVVPSTVSNFAFTAIQAAHNLKCVVFLGDEITFTGTIQSGKSVDGTVFYVKNNTIKTDVVACGTKNTESVTYFKEAIVIGSETEGTPSLCYADGTVTFSTPKYLNSYAVIIAQYSDSGCSLMDNAVVYSDTAVPSGDYTFEIANTDGKFYKAFVFNNLVEISPITMSIICE